MALASSTTEVAVSVGIEDEAPAPSVGLDEDALTELAGIKCTPMTDCADTAERDASATKNERMANVLN
jgi:hypothetical protein